MSADDEWKGCFGRETGDRMIPPPVQSRQRDGGGSLRCASTDRPLLSRRQGASEEEPAPLAVATARERSRTRRALVPG